MRKILLVLMILGVASCARNRREVDIDPNADSTLHVENRHYGDVDIYVVHDGSRVRVGTVTASSDQTFTLPSRLIGTVGTMQLIAHGVGLSGNLGSETFAIRTAMQINWTLDSNLSRGTLSIY